MDLKHLIPHQRRRESGPALDLRFATDKTIVPRVGPTLEFTRASSGTFVNANGILVGKTTSTTNVNPANVAVGSTVTFVVPSGSIVGWLNGAVVSVMEDTDGDDQIGSQRYINGTITNKTDTQLTLIVSAKVGTFALNSWFVSYRGARIDHNPDTLACRGLLIEESRTNLYSRSQEFNDGAWGRTGTSVGTNAINAVDGTLTADKLIEDTSLGLHNILRTITPPATAHTLSVFAKKGERNWIALRAGGANTFFNLDTGVATSAINSPTITKYGNGWYRCTVTSSSGTQNQIWMSPDGVATSYTGDGTSGIYIWGAQLEAGSFATSYIPTTAGSAIRSTDLCNISGSAFSGIYNQPEGTLIVVADEFRRGVAYSLLTRISNSVNPGSNRYSIGSYGGKTGVASPLEFVVNRDSIVSYSALPTSSTSNFKAALAYSVDNMRGSLNGTLATADSPPSALIVGANTLSVGGVGVWLIEVKYYHKRIADSSLQTLTATVTNTITYNGVQIQYNSSDKGLQITN